MMATVPQVISGLGHRKFQADGFLLTVVCKVPNPIAAMLSNCDYMRRVSSLHTQNYQATSVS